MKDIVFNSQEELYARIRPALRSKRKILINAGYKKIKESDIWEFMRNKIWINSYGLELCDMVDDILHASNEKIDMYCHNKYMFDDIQLEVFEMPKLKKD